MLTTATDLVRFHVHTTEGGLVHLRDLCFDDDRWMVRYFVVDTHRRRPGREVLIAPSSVVSTDRSRRQLDTNLTMDQIRSSPDIDSVRPASRRPVSTPPQYVGLPFCWPSDDVSVAHDDEHDPHLQSARSLLDYTVKALDRDVGRVDDMLVDSPPWEIRYVVVDTSSWASGRRVLVPTARVTLISRHELAAHVRLTGAVIRNAPSYDPSRALSARDDARLLEYYSREPRS